MGHPSHDARAQLLTVGLDIMATAFSQNGNVSAQLGDSTSEVAETDLAEWWQHVGFASRPALPSQGSSSAQAVALKYSDKDIVLATRDTRGTAILGNLGDGETCVYAPASQSRATFKADGSARLMTTDDNTVNGNVVYAGISSFYQSTNGAALGGEWRVYAPWGGHWQDSSGFHLRTWHGVKLDAGGMNLPPPLSISGSQFSVSADMVFVDGAMVALGRNNGLGQALVQALPLQVVIVQLAQAIVDLATAVGAFTGTGTFPGLVAAASELAAALAAAGTITTACATRTCTGS